MRTILGALMLALMLMIGVQSTDSSGGQLGDTPQMGLPVECTSQHYLTSDKRCVNCSVCPQDLVTIEVCTPLKDTVCGPFHNFSFKVHSESNTKPPLSNNMVEKSDMEHWKKLAFSLIGVLCFLVVVATIIVFVTYARFLKYRGTKTNHQSTEERGEIEGEYVVIHRRPSGYVPSTLEELAQLSGGSSVSALLEGLSPTTSPRTGSHSYLSNLRRHNYRPQRRLLNEYVDDVFESEDSNGSRNSGTRYLHTIPETPDGDL